VIQPPRNLAHFGRSRALEILLSGDDFDADIAERYGWVNRALDDDKLDSFVDALASRLATFDRKALNWPGQRARRAKVRTMGYGIRSDFELNFGRHLPALGDDADALREGGAHAWWEMNPLLSRRAHWCQP